ncbi:MAG: type II toxin-antitoxin system prevent-host-death family antitoxin [bacterium]|nr:MAG: type II toxin-antitoxin system prevent-host-death family antitoxin [bacterium]
MNIYPKAFSATELKTNPSEILNLAVYGGYEVMIEKYGVEIAKVVPVKKTIKRTDYKDILKKYAGSIPDFPDVTSFRRNRKYVKIFD